MAINTLGNIDVPLELFGGLDTELAPSDLPEGVSPANQDVVFLPGSVATRPALHRIFSTPFSENPTYEKTYLQPNGEALNLFLDANGVVYQEDVENAPGVATQISQQEAGSTAQSATAFGREYIAISDGLHGVGVPLQYDGTNLDRVSQDGPAAAVTAQNVNLSFFIVASPSGLSEFGGFAISTATQSGNIVTLTLTGLTPLFNAIEKGLTTGDKVQVIGIGVAGYNGIQTLLSVTVNQITYQLLTTGLANSSGGTMNTGLVKVTTTTDTGFTVGQNVTIAGAGVSGYNGTWAIRDFDALPPHETHVFYVYISAYGLAASGGGTIVVTGNISPGIHQVVVMFQTRSGYVTKPSPVFAWTAGGGVGVIISNLPIGPPNVVARILAFTGAGGDNFFYIPVNVTVQNPAGGAPTIINSTVVPDNTTTTVTLDFDDNTLFAALAIDIPGNNLFALVVLSPCLGFFNYASRLFAWGEYNKIQNALNLGFEGGYNASSPTVPLGYSIVDNTAAELVIGGAWDSGMAWKIHGNGTLTDLGLLEQQMKADEEGIPIVQPGTLYRFRIWGKVDATSADPITGDVIVELADGGGNPTVSIPCSAFTTTGNFVEVVFNSPTSAVPNGIVYSIKVNGLNAGFDITLDEQMLYPDFRPYFDDFRISYVINPESFDGITGNLGPTSDPTPLRTASEYRDNFYFRTAIGLHVTRDNGTGEPSSWTVNEQSKKCGALSVHGCDAGEFGTGTSAEDFELSIARSGLYIFAGGDPVKISQEIQPIWDTINWEFAHRAWIKNDTVSRRAYIGLPTEEATAPNLILIMDYRELKTWETVQSADPIHISYTGKMISSDLTRKWTVWTLAMNCGELLQRPNNDVQFCLGSGNGLTPGLEPGFSQIYFLDSGKFTDDDYGPITSFYTTYFFVNHDQEQALQLGSHRKFYAYLAMFITGIGEITVTPLVDNLHNPWESTPPYDLALLQNFDFEWGLNITEGERVAFKVQVAPLSGQTDCYFDMGKMIVTMRQNPWSPIRGAV